MKQFTENFYRESQKLWVDVFGVQEGDVVVLNGAMLARGSLGFDYDWPTMLDFQDGEELKVAGIIPSAIEVEFDGEHYYVPWMVLGVLYKVPGADSQFANYEDLVDLLDWCKVATDDIGHNVLTFHGGLMGLMDREFGEDWQKRCIVEGQKVSLRVANTINQLFIDNFGDEVFLWEIEGIKDDVMDCELPASDEDVDYVVGEDGTIHLKGQKIQYTQLLSMLANAKMIKSCKQ